MSLISFDDTPIARFAVPPLTSVDQPIAATASRAVELIIDTQRGNELPDEPVVVPAALVRRHSTAGPAAHMPAEARGQRRQSHRFLWLFALAWAGGAVAYVPFLTILLPLRVVADRRRRQRPLSSAYITFFGALAASVGNILFGWLSDRSRHRRPWIAAGLALSARSSVAVPLGRDRVAILALVVLLAAGAQHDARAAVRVGGGPGAARR